MCTSYCASLRSSLCSLGLEVPIVFFPDAGKWLVISLNCDRLSKCVVMQSLQAKDYTK